MRLEDAMPAPFVDDLGGDLDNLLPSHAEDEGYVLAFSLLQHLALVVHPAPFKPAD